MNAPHFPTSVPNPILDADAVLEGYALSPQQARQWRWQQEYDAATVADPVLTLRIDGKPDLEHLRAGLAQVLERHEILRTAYRRLPAMSVPVQVIAAQAELPWYAADNGEHGEHGVHVLERNDDYTLLRLRLPAFQADAASLAMLAGAWCAACAGQTDPQEPLQYADYAAWRLELAATPGDSHPLWQVPMAPPGALPLRPQAAVGLEGAQSGFHAIHLGPALVQRWHAASAALEVAPEHVLLAAFVALQYLHGGAERLTLGYERQRRGGPLDGAIGLYGEALPLTLDALDSSDFASLCRTLARQDALLDQWRDACPETHLAAPFALGFRWVAPADPLLDAAGWHIVEASAPAAPVQLLLETGPAGLGWHCNRRLYDTAALSILSGQLSTLLDNACRDPSARLARLSACSADEQRLLIDTFARGVPAGEAQEAQYRAVTGLPGLAQVFTRQAALHPERVAVRGPSGCLSYAAVAERAQQVARHLVGIGVTPGARVAHLLARDVDAVVGMLGILLAGACYVPVDPGYPAQRIAYILDDCLAQAVLTESSLFEQLPATLRGRAVAIDQLAEAPDAPLPPPSRDAAAYVIYTSGSTGQPKGVPITHANALHSLGARLAYYPQPVRRYLLLSSFAFDSSIAGLFWSLAQGGALHICCEAEQKDPAAIAAALRNEEISHVLALPSLYAHVLEALDEPLAHLGTVIVAGESCPPQLVQAHLRRQPQANLYNEYGPTEASVWSTVARCGAEGIPGPVPIGRPIPHASVYVLDAQGAPVARGIPGEIHIGGPGLSPGYAGRPDLNAEKFVAAAHPALAGQRLYRSGDLALVGQDGELVFLGRADAQVKVRGHRIEPGEIESALREASGASLAVVLAERGDDGVRLRAFVESTQAGDSEALRSALVRRLPEHMLPADIQFLPLLPRTPNGKIDNAALLALRPTRQRQPYVAPRDATEAALAAMWSELLGGAPPGIDDDFFALGGHSLLVVRLVHLIKAAFGQQVPVAAVFGAPTIRALGAQLAGHAATAPAAAPADESAAACLARLRAGDGKPPLFLLHRPAGDVQHYAPLLAALPADLPVHGLVLPPGCTPAQATLADLARQYADAIRTVQPQGPYHLCGWSMGGLLALELAALLEQSGQRVAMLGIVDTSFDPGDAPLSAPALERLAERELDAPSRARLADLPEARAQLGALTAEPGKLAQLRALRQWTERHGLALAAPREMVDATLTAWAHARDWVAAFAPRPVDAAIHLWLAQETLAAQPALPSRWVALTRGALRAETIPGDHDDILSQPSFQAGFATALVLAMEVRA